MAVVGAVVVMLAVLVVLASVVMVVVVVWVMQLRRSCVCQCFCGTPNNLPKHCKQCGNVFW